MRNANERKQVQIGGRTEDLGYDFHQAIYEATRLWSQLKKQHTARAWKYPPRQGAFDRLVTRWTEHPGKSIIHLDDLPNFVHTRLDREGLETIKQLWSTMVSRCTFRQAYQRYGAIYQTARKAHKTISVRALRTLEGKTISVLETHVTAIRPGANGKYSTIRLPVNICNEAFAKLFGYYGDLSHEKFGHVTKSRELQDDLVKAIRAALGPMHITRGKRGHYMTTYATSLVKHVQTIGGLNTDTIQIEADNPSPLFLFVAPKSVVREYLQALFEAEGGVSHSEHENRTRHIDLHQAVPINLGKYNLIVPRHPRRLSFRAAPPTVLDKACDQPPRLLLSTALLLLRFDITSHLWPADIYTNKEGNVIARWRLIITGASNILNFATSIQFVSARKQRLIQPNSPSPLSPFFLEILNSRMRISLLK